MKISKSVLPHIILLGGSILYVSLGISFDIGIVGKHTAKVIAGATTANPHLSISALIVGSLFSTYRKFIISIAILSVIIIPITYYGVSTNAELLGTPLNTSETIEQIFYWFVGIILFSHISNLLRLGIDRLRN